MKNNAMYIIIMCRIGDHSVNVVICSCSKCCPLVLEEGSKEGHYCYVCIKNSERESSQKVSMPDTRMYRYGCQPLAGTQ